MILGNELENVFKIKLLPPGLTETVAVKDSEEEKLKSKSQGGKLG